MQCKFAFGLSDDGRFLITVEVMPAESQSLPPGFTMTTFSDENLFIYYVVLAELDGESTMAIISQVLLVAAEREPLQPWIAINLTERQYSSLGLSKTRVVNAGEDSWPPLGF